MPIRKSEEVGEDFRRIVGPMIESKSVTQEELAERLTELAGSKSPLAQSTVSRWINNEGNPRPLDMRNAVERLLAEIRAGKWPAKQDGEITEGRARPGRRPREEENLLDLWGYQRARAIAELTELLREDTAILQMRAEAALNASRATLLEAEKAPLRGLPTSFNVRDLEKIVRAIDALTRFGGGPVGGMSNEGPEVPDSPPSDGEP